MALPVLTSTKNSTGGGTGDLTLTKPASVAVGDLLLIIVGDDTLDTATNPFGTITGFTKKVASNLAAPDCHFAVYYRIADGTEAATAVSPSTGTEQWGFYCRLTHGDGFDADPFNVVGTPQVETTGYSSAIAEVTTDVADCLAFFVLAFDGADATAWVVSSGAGWTIEDEQKSGTAANEAEGLFGTKGMASAGGTAVVTIGHSTNSDGQQSVQFAIMPAQGGPVGGGDPEFVAATEAATSIKWTPAPGDDAEIYVHRGTTPGFTKSVGTRHSEDIDLGGDPGEYEDSDTVAAATKYYYAIEWNDGTANYSNEVEVETAHNPPTAIAFSNIALDGMTFTLTAGSGSGSEDHRVFVTQGATFVQAIDLVGTLVGAIAGLTDGLEYTFRALTFDAAVNGGVGAYSTLYEDSEFTVGPSAATGVGTLALFDFRTAIDPIQTTGVVRREALVDGVSALVNRDGLLTDVHAKDAPMEWVAPIAGVLPEATQGLALFAAGTNVVPSSAHFGNWATFDSATVDLNVGVAPTVGGAVEADKLHDANASASARLESYFTVADDSTVWTVSFFVAKDPTATAFVRLEVQVRLGSPEITGDGIDIDPSDGSYQVVGSPAFYGVVDLGAGWRIYVGVKNNGTGNTNLRSIIYPAYGTVLGTQAVSAQGSVTAWGHDVKNLPALTPHVATDGAQASQVARRHRLSWYAAPAGGAFYWALRPYMVAGAGSELYLFSLGGDVDAGEAGYAIRLSPTTSGKVEVELHNGTAAVETSAVKAWEAGQLVEVFASISATGVLNVSVAVDWSTWIAATPSGTLTLPDDWEAQVAALGEKVADGSGRGSALWLFEKFSADTSLDADDMRQLWREGNEGLGS